jgi:hypothetical protein
MGVVYLFGYQASVSVLLVVNDGFMTVDGWALVDVLSIPYHLYLLTPPLVCVWGATWLFRATTDGCIAVLGGTQRRVMVTGGILKSQSPPPHLGACYCQWPHSCFIFRGFCRHAQSRNVSHPCASVILCPHVAVSVRCLEALHDCHLWHVPLLNSA